MKSRVSLPQEGHHPLAGSGRSHVHVAVIRIAHERMTTLLQLAINFVEQHVGQ